MCTLSQVDVCGVSNKGGFGCGVEVKYFQQYLALPGCIEGSRHMILFMCHRLIHCTATMHRSMPAAVGEL